MVLSYPQYNLLRLKVITNDDRHFTYMVSFNFSQTENCKGLKFYL